MTTHYETNGVIDHISGLSSAEEIFTYLLLPFEQEVLNVSRLHIMKRMGQYLKGTDFAGYDEEEVFLATRQHLKRAYMDFVDSTPLQEKVFKVFSDKAAEHTARLVAIEPIGQPAQ